MKLADKDVQQSRIMLVVLMVLSPAWLILGAFIGYSWGERPGAHMGCPGRTPHEHNQKHKPNHHDSTIIHPSNIRQSSVAGS